MLLCAPLRSEPPPAAPPFGVYRNSETEYFVDGRAPVWSRPSGVCYADMEARIEPWFENGVARGFRFIQVPPRSVYAAFGFEEGDVVRSVNGIAIDSAGVPLAAYDKLRDAKEFSVLIERRGRSIRVIYRVRRDPLPGLPHAPH